MQIASNFALKPKIKEITQNFIWRLEIEGKLEIGI